MGAPIQWRLSLRTRLKACFTFICHTVARHLICLRHSVPCPFALVRGAQGVHRSLARVHVACAQREFAEHEAFRAEQKRKRLEEQAKRDAEFSRQERRLGGQGEDRHEQASEAPKVVSTERSWGSLTSRSNRSRLMVRGEWVGIIYFGS